MDKGSNNITPLPVILITGFLGAGKTTFLNKLAGYLKSNGFNMAMIINEFGKVNIDKVIIDNDPAAIYEVNQGSIFCACTRDQFISAVNEVIKADQQYDILLIEATGLAKTSDLGRYLAESGYSDKLKITNNVCITDALNFHKVYETLPAVVNQIKEASLCIINKTDIASKEQIDKVKDKIRKHNPDVDIICAQYGEMDFSVLIDFDNLWVSDLSEDNQISSEVRTITLVSNCLVIPEKLKAFIEKYLKNILRAKGYLNTDAGWMFFEIIGEDVLVKPFDKNISGSGRLVIIGVELDEAEMRKGFKETFLC